MAASNKSKTKNTRLNKGIAKKESNKAKADRATKTSKSRSSGKKNDTEFVLDAVMVINEAKELHKKLNELSKSKGMVTLDASTVEMIDTASLQLLLAFVATMKIKKSHLRWKNPSQNFLDRASILNLVDGLCLN